jgi:hypothetical protein
MTQRLRVAQVITRFTAGAGGVALRGVLALDPDRFEVVFVTGSGSIIPQAQAAGFEVVVLPRLRSEIALPDDWRVLADLRACLRAGGFDTVHTHSAKAGVVGRIAAHQVGCGRIVHTFHGFPFHQFQSRPRQAAYVRIERSVGKFTDAFLAVGSAVAAEGLRGRVAPPGPGPHDRRRGGDRRSGTGAVGQGGGTAPAWRAARHAGRGHGRAA